MSMVDHHTIEGMPQLGGYKQYALSKGFTDNGLLYFLDEVDKKRVEF